MRGEEQNELFLALKQGNVVTFGATSRRYREGISQSRDVRGNVATLQRVGLNNVATSQRLIKIHVATLITHVVTFQRV